MFLETVPVSFRDCSKKVTFQTARKSYQTLTPNLNFQQIDRNPWGIRPFLSASKDTLSLPPPSFLSCANKGEIYVALLTQGNVFYMENV